MKSYISSAPADKINPSVETALFSRLSVAVVVSTVLLYGCGGGGDSTPKVASSDAASSVVPASGAGAGPSALTLAGDGKGTGTTTAATTAPVTTAPVTTTPATTTPATTPATTAAATTGTGTGNTTTVIPPPAPPAVAQVVTPATVPPVSDLAPLAADQSYIDNVSYDVSAAGALPTAADNAAVTHHRIVLNGKNRTYTATAGHLVVRDPSTNAPEASLFYTAYTLDGESTTKRPVTVFFNGGPGSPSSFLHMGSFAPMRVFTAQNATVSGPNDVTFGENPQTLLDKTDMVFVDPVGTGYSEAVAPSKNSDFWSVNPDVNVMAGFIARYVQVNNRGISPLMVYGESYGGPRAGMLSFALQDIYGIKLTGLIMQSPALNFYETATLPGQFLAPRRSPRPSFLLPTVTMAAQYNGAITDPVLSKLSLADLFQASEDFSFNQLPPVRQALQTFSLAQSVSTWGTNYKSSFNFVITPPQLEPSAYPTSSLVNPQASALAAPLIVQANALTGNLPVVAQLPKSYTGATDPATAGEAIFSIGPLTGFITEALAGSSAVPTSPIKSTNDVFALVNEVALNNRALASGMISGKTLGLYDLRKTLAAAASQDIATVDYLTWDPSLDDLAAYAPIFASYAYNTLQYQAVSNYAPLQSAISTAWNHSTTYPDASVLPFPDATIFIADEMLINPDMHVMTTAGYYDAVVPAAQVDWDMQSVAATVPAAQMKSMYTRILLPSGHMGYADDPSRQTLHDTLSTFMIQALATSIPAVASSAVR